MPDLADTPARTPADTSSEAETSVETGPTFAGLGLPADIMAAVDALGFTTPTPIQSRAIPALLARRDIVGVAQTGTGKTAAFGLPMLAAVDGSSRETQALVLTPTRELAIQVADAISSFLPAGSRATVLPIYGGASFVPQLRGLERGAQVVVGTPGRVMDMIERRALNLSTLRFVVLDEADEMLRMGFAEDVETILAGTPKSKQVALFSATMPAAIRAVANTHLSNPVEISIARQSTPIGSVEQRYAVVPFRNKTEAVARVLATSDAEAAIVFVRTRETAEEVGAALSAMGVNAASISGDVAQRDREKIVDRLRAGTLDVLVATDVAARGLDVERIGLVVNFDVPREVETYVHRIGRTGRAGRTGVALTFLTPKEKPRLRTIERVTGSTLVETRLPSRADVFTHRLGAALGSAQARIGASPLATTRAQLVAHCEETGTDILDVAAALLALAVGDDGVTPEVPDEVALRDDRRSYGEREERGDRDGRGRERSGRRDSRESGGNRYRISVGHRDGVTPQGIVGAITGEGGLRGAEIGKIDIFGSFSIVEIPLGIDAEAERRISAAKVAGRQLRIKADSGPPSRGGREAGPRDRDDRPRRPRTFAH
ncbi:DEAD/DEAH box helicase [Miniimonas sp. S16]|uniref:DEAD/DEAH box helicase n=1 Tax=Miniimonas sp. S16 TaxID=2171623 RepID=UPI000D52754D|nr:DEAD/DEAH box helicase [Miniimonas sp. S16]